MSASGLLCVLFLGAAAGLATEGSVRKQDGGYSDEELRKKLTPEQYRVTRENGTEPPFKNAYWDHHEPGVYVDVASGEALFSSTEKFDSGTGWPSFTAPLEAGSIVEREDRSLWSVRTEVRSRRGGSHLGHVFDDGPGPTGRRYCINSAALRFVPAERLEAEGYGKYLRLFRGRTAPGAAGKAATETAVFAAGCFWGVEEAFGKLKGVVRTRAGYTGGTAGNPTYEQVCSGTTGHAEAVEVEYDPAQVSYEELLEAFWGLHDPTTQDRQGPDVGSQYRSAVFYAGPEQKAEALASKEKLEKSGKLGGKKTATQIVPAGEFYPAEEYHQKYFAKGRGGRSCPAR